VPLDTPGGTVVASQQSKRGEIVNGKAKTRGFRLYRLVVLAIVVFFFFSFLDSLDGKLDGLHGIAEFFRLLTKERE
jgi:hypothetical protein